MKHLLLNSLLALILCDEVSATEEIVYQDYAYNSYYEVLSDEQGKITVRQNEVKLDYTSLDVSYECSSPGYICMSADAVEFSVPICQSGKISVKEWIVNDKKYEIVQRREIDILAIKGNFYQIVSEGSIEFDNGLDFNVLNWKKEYVLVNNYYYNCDKGLIGFGFTYPELMDMGRIYWLVGDVGFGESFYKKLKSK